MHYEAPEVHGWIFDFGVSNPGSVMIFWKFHVFIKKTILWHTYIQVIIFNMYCGPLQAIYSLSASQVGRMPT